MATASVAMSAIGFIASPGWATDCTGWRVETIGAVANPARCDWSELADAALQRQEIATRSLVGKPSVPRARLGADPFDRRLEDALKKSTRPVLIAISAPAQLEPGKSGTIRAILLTADNQTMAGPMGFVPDGGQTTQISVTADMQIALLANDMEIAPTESDWRTLTRASPSAWSWKVTASEAGNKLITLVVRGKIRIGDEDKSFDLHHANHNFAVVETTQGRVLRHINNAKGVFDAAQELWLMIVGVGAVIGALFVRMFRRKTKQAVEPEA